MSSSDHIVSWILTGLIRGGITVDFKGAPVLSGVAVARQGAALHIREHALEDDYARVRLEIKAFVKRELSSAVRRGKVAFGLWHDVQRQEHLLEIADVFPPTEVIQAIELGRSRHQESVYLLDTNTTIEV